MTQDHGLAALAEVRAIDRLIAGFLRHADQWNRPHEADAELVRLTALGPETYLAATIDGVGDELAHGFYRDPFTAGWVVVMASLSDLAAVGAAPIGVLLALTLPPDPAFAERVAAGAREALVAAGVPALGGDTNTAAAPGLTSCGLGLVQGRPIGRTGIRPGDEVWATGRLGAGNALAIARMLGLPDALAPEAAYRPRARTTEGQRLRTFARAMMDTSDGPMSTLDHLARLNGVGLRVAFDLARLVDPARLAAFEAAGVPRWPLVCGEHGEYELMVAIAPEDEPQLLAAVPGAVRVAVAKREPGIDLALPDGRTVAFDGSFIRNLSDRTAGDWTAYAREFAGYGERLGLA